MPGIAGVWARSFGFMFGAKVTDSIVVLKVIKTSAVEKAGLKVNDIITEFNGQNIRYKSRPEAAKIFKESAFTNNTFKILRNNSGAPLFHFFMATNNEIALRIANSVVNPKLGF